MEWIINYLGMESCNGSVGGQRVNFWKKLTQLQIGSGTYYRASDHYLMD